MKKNNKGFTLAELLAVIVILAIIIVLLMPAAMDTMERSRQRGFRMFAQKVATAAREKFNVDLMFDQIDGGTTKCYTLEQLGLDEHGSYRGLVKIVVDANLIPGDHTISLTDRSYSVTDANFTELDTVELDEPKPATTTYTCP